MNVIVSNKQKEIIDNANIDAIKDLNGLFNVDDLISKFKNYFFSKMILDATSVVNFTMPEVLEKLAREIGTERLVILLPGNPEPPKEFIDKLISLNITQFSTKIDDIVKFISSDSNLNTQSMYANNDINVMDNNFANVQSKPLVDNDLKYQKGNVESFPANGMSFSDTLANFNVSDGGVNNNFNSSGSSNSFGNVNNLTADAQNNTLNEMYSQNIQKTNENFNSDFIQNGLDNHYGFENYSENVQSNNQINNVSANFTSNGNNIQGVPVKSNINTDDLLVGPASNSYASDIYSNNNTTVTMSNVNNSDNTNLNMQSDASSSSFFPLNFYGEKENQNLKNSNYKKIIGFINVTEHAGSTTLIYLMHKSLEERFHKKCVGIEVDKNDFKLFQSNNLISTSSAELNNVINNTEADIILVDLNGYNLTLCNDALYLIEPSIIKINKLVMNNRSIFKELINKKVILNKSLLQNKDVEIFGKEAGINIFMSIPPLNDRINNEVIARLITVLNLN